MREIKITKFICEICGEEYETSAEALSCESRPITQDKGVKIGDTVIVISGDGAGERVVVTNRSVCSRSWGHYLWERYWHTVLINVNFKGFGSRTLVFDDYRTLVKS